MKTTKTNIEELLISPEFVADPYPTLRILREEEPVYWSAAIGGWLLTRYDDILISFKDTAHFSNENRLGKAVEYLPDEKRRNYKPFEDHYATKGLLHSDPPDHTRLRSLVVKEFTNSARSQRTSFRLNFIGCGSWPLSTIRQSVRTPIDSSLATSFAVSQSRGDG